MYVSLRLFRDCPSIRNIWWSQALAEALGSNPRLTDLNLAENYIGETKWDPVQRQQTSAAVHAFAAALESNTTMTRLDLSNNSVGDDGVLALARSMKANKTMKALELAGNNVVTPKGREVLTQMTIRKNKRADKTRKLLGK